MTLKRINKKAAKVPKEVIKKAKAAKPDHKKWINDKIKEEKSKIGE